jgi:Rieske Fe-S protein
VRLALGGALAVALWPSSVWAKKIAVKLAALPALQKVGGWLIAKVKGKRILLIRDADGSVRAVTPRCSHKAHRLTYDPQKREIVCPNHGSRFDLKGKVLKGPAKKPLATVYWTKLDRAKQRVIIKLD